MGNNDNGATQHNPMKNLTIIGIPRFERDFRWELWYDCCGGFIGLHDTKNEYNVYSTVVIYDLDELIKVAEKANQKILGDIDVFKTYIAAMDMYMTFAKKQMNVKKFHEVYNKIEEITKSFEEWVNND